MKVKHVILPNTDWCIRALFDGNKIIGYSSKDISIMMGGRADRFRDYVNKITSRLFENEIYIATHVWGQFLIKDSVVATQ